MRSLADEVPFDIPDSWEWVRLGELFQHNTGKALNASNRTGQLKQYITTSNLYWDRFELDNLKEMHFSDSEVEKCTVVKGDLLVCEGGDIGRAAIWSYDCPMCIQNHIHRLRAYLPLCTRFFYYLFDLYKHAGWIGGKGIGIQGLSSNAIHSLLFPFPPLAEQYRIVDAFDTMQPYTDSYAIVESSLDKLNSTFPERLKKSILQEAVQGKLVSQDPSDEPAEALLERIRAEKQRLIKEGKIKKDKHESVIFRRDNSHYEKLDGVERCIDNELPFEIPENWCWAQLGSISSYAETKQKINAANADSDIWGLDLEDIEKGGRLIVRKTVGERKAIGDKTVFSKGDILYSKLRPYLLKILVAPECGICTPEIVPFQMYGGIVSEYIVNFLRSPYVDNLINSITYGVKMPRVGTETMTTLFVPVPPLAEQHRIVQRIEELLPLVKGL